MGRGAEEVPGVAAVRAGSPRLPRLNPVKVAAVLVSLALFVLALELMKSGAGGLGSWLRRGVLVDDPVGALGFGWSLAYVVLSGSPVAAATLTFLADGAIDTIQAYAMIAGSRLGASMVVILLGFLYVIRGRQTRRGLATGVLAMIVTVTVYGPALLVGLIVLASGVVPAVQVDVAAVDVIDRLYSPLVERVSATLPGAGVFVLGTVVMIGAFALFDRGLPQVRLERTFGRDERFVFRPIVMFLGGLLVTAVTFSVSVSVGLLVPLSVRGLIRRENIIPYVMGANVTTFVDTLVVAVLVQSAEGFTVVLIEMLSVAAVSLVLLSIGFDNYERVVNAAVDRVLATTRNLSVFLVVLFVVPLLLVVVS